MDRIATTWRACDGAESVGIIAIDIDGFKAISDTYGHDAGDGVLREVASRMKSAICATDTISRLGGDEFIFLVNDVGTVGGLTSAIQHFLDAVCLPLQFEAVAMTPNLSCGVAIYPTNGATEKDFFLC
jgi:diguanylate cyclase (GGDEF)-like protein